MDLNLLLDTLSLNVTCLINFEETDAEFVSSLFSLSFAICFVSVDDLFDCDLL